MNFPTENSAGLRSLCGFLAMGRFFSRLIVTLRPTLYGRSNDGSVADFARLSSHFSTAWLQHSPYVKSTTKKRFLRTTRALRQAARSALDCVARYRLTHTSALPHAHAPSGHRIPRNLKSPDVTPPRALQAPPPRTVRQATRSALDCGSSLPPYPHIRTTTRPRAQRATNSTQPQVVAARYLTSPHKSQAPPSPMPANP